MNKNAYAEYIESKGLHVVGENPIINRITSYNGKFYTAISNDSLGYPILCKTKENVLEPLQFVPSL